MCRGILRDVINAAKVTDSEKKARVIFQASVRLQLSHDEL